MQQEREQAPWRWGEYLLAVVGVAFVLLLIAVAWGVPGLIWR